MTAEPAERELMAVLFAFEVWEGGERRYVNEEAIVPSKQAMLEAQLSSLPQQTLIDSAPGILIYSNFQPARLAAQGLIVTAARVVIREVRTGEVTGGTQSWNGRSGVRYTAVPGGLTLQVK